MLPAAACACACACHVGVCVCVCVCGGACVCGCAGACVSTCTLIPVKHKHASTLVPVKPVAVRESVAAWVSGVSECLHFFVPVKPVNWVPALALAAVRVSLRVSVVLCLLAGCSVEPIGMRVRLRQYLYFCTRKTSKLSTCAGVAAADALVSLVIICTFVPVKPVN
jgi:hypothetical protein